MNVKDMKHQLFSSNYDAIFTIPTQDGKGIAINTYDMDAIIKRMVPIIQQIDPAFMDKVKNQIQERCRQNGIDDTFCFQQGTKERFEQVDSLQPIKTGELNKEQTIDSARKEKGTQESTTFINSVDIVEMLNPEVLKQKIELPNGTKISARQYIQEIVAPHIPSNGTYILNNGSQISVKQYIEEFILGEGQEKYKGDISKLLSENTRSNNGTITVKGEQVNTIDIVNTLNPELMKRKLKLPNGAEIPAAQYIQELVAPHIPSDGKFILRSNGLGISAKQFIEEAVMFVGQEKYNGDIKALLEAMTTANNGAINIQGLQKQHENKMETNRKEKEMVTLPNGVQIPRKQYEEEYETQKPTTQSGKNYLVDKLYAIGVAAGVAVGEGINGVTAGTKAGTSKLSTQKIGKATINITTSKKREVQAAEDKEKGKGENQRNDE